MTATVKSANLGFPRIGLKRELKKAVESFWKEEIDTAMLMNIARDLRKRHWGAQKEAGLDLIPSNDFSLYDQVLDMSATLGAVPDRYAQALGYTPGTPVDLDLYFAMARGRQKDNIDVVAMEMTKWFDTNYHYIVPEFTAQTKFALSSTKVIDEYKEAKALGIETRPVLIGPVSFLLLGKGYDGVEPLSLLDNLVPVYLDILNKLKDAGAQTVQIDEPFLAMDIDSAAKTAYENAYKSLGNCGVEITLTTYFEGLRENINLAANLPVAGLHIDLSRAPGQLDDVISALKNGNKTLSLGLIDGRNIWKSNLENLLTLGQKAVNELGADRVIVAPSCSLLHSPVDLAEEIKLDEELKSWLAFARQKLDEIKLLADALSGQKDESAFAANAKDIQARASSTRIHNTDVKDRVSNLKESDIQRKSPFDQRIVAQRQHLGLPALPTTTIGSFPQTTDVRQARAKFKRGEMNRDAYEKFLEEKTVQAMKWQDDIGIDVPVHGEFERNDMVEYFGEKLNGFAFTKNGWVQSYGSRCVKPPVIFGDVDRPEAMTVFWSSFAQEHTDKPVKGMLTGPVTILQWSFVRDDQPREITCKQIGLAIRDEVKDLENAGIQIIQIDEPALREGLPLRKVDWPAYLKWAVESFRISSSGIEDTTQIHTHMCYCEFNDIIDSIAALDADVISIETSRSAMELLDAFVDYKYPNEIGPGVYDIHSPRIPKREEMETLLRKALKVLRGDQIWVNPDCGLKTRSWEEVRPALVNMVEAAKTLREELDSNDVKAAS